MKLSTKMFCIGLCSVASLGILFTIVLVANGIVGTNLDMSTERAEQLATVNAIQAAQTALLLGGMDSIIDKDEGDVDAERLQSINDNAEFLTTSIPLLTELADTEQEVALSRSVKEGLEALIQGIQTDLVALIRESGAESSQIIAEFTEIDDTLDENGVGVAQSLDDLEAAVRQRLAEAGGAEQLIQAVSLMGEVRATHLELMLAAMDSIIDKDEGKVAGERKAAIDASIAVLNEKEPELDALAATTAEQELVQIMKDDLVALDKGIRVDLFDLIENSFAKDPAEILAAFVKIDDDLDRYGDGYAEALGSLDTALRERLGKNDTAQIIATLDGIGGARTAFLSLMLAAMDSIIDKDEGNINEERQQEISGALALLDGHVTTLAELAANNQEKQLVTAASEGIRALGTGIQVDLKELIEVSAVRMQEIEAAFVEVDDTLDEHAGKVASELAQIAESVQGEVDEAKGDLEKALSLAWTVSVATFLISTFVLMTILYLVTRSIVGPLNTVITGLRSGSNQVQSASSQVASSSQQMAQGASEQASSLEETSASLEEMASMTKQNADSAGQANSMTSDAQSAAKKGLTAMTEMTEAIDKIKGSSDETAKIIKTIDEIAFQTNLLALNAAVEAARAGDAGKGFAVVAEEVRNLAQRSAEAARNTASLIEESQQNADNGVQVSREVADILSQIVEQVEKVTQLVGEVASASNEQAQGIEQVNTAVSQMDQITQSNAANSEEAASASEELSAQSTELNEMVIQLAAVVGGNTETGSGKAAITHEAANERRNSAGPLSQGAAPSGQAHTLAISHTERNIVNPQTVIPLDDDDF
jgi:hypothetical protein